MPSNMLIQGGMPGPNYRRREKTTERKAPCPYCVLISNESSGKKNKRQPARGEPPGAKKDGGQTISGGLRNRDGG